VHTRTRIIIIYQHSTWSVSSYSIVSIVPVILQYNTILYNTMPETKGKERESNGMKKEKHGVQQHKHGVQQHLLHKV